MLNITGKRASFVGVQQSHTISTQACHPPQFRTSYEYVIGSRTDPMFCHNARQEGVVKEITPKGVIVQYKDGTTEGFETGTVYGRAEGSIYPHNLVSELKVGQKFKEGDNIVYNTGFFERDKLDPNAVVFKNSFTVRVALLETSQTHEDSCAISKALGEKLRASTTKMKSIVVDFSQSIHEVVSANQSVKPKDALMVITDEISSGMGFDAESLKVLKKISNQAPKAGYLGTISRIEVFYNGELSDMTESLRNLAKKSNNEMKSRFDVKGLKGVTGRVNDDYAIAGKPLTLNKAEIRIFIDRSTSAGVGDKGVFANQLKCTIGEVMDYKMYTSQGLEIDAVFSYKSISSRIVNSPMIVGTTISLLNVCADRMVKAYKGLPVK